MNIRRRPPARTPLDDAIDSALSELAGYQTSDKEYATVLTQLEMLYKIKDQNKPCKVSNDTWAIIGANLTGILIIVSYEHAHVVVSKALSFVAKAR